MMIYDDDVCFHRFATHARYEARVEVRALLAKTGLGSRVDLTPKGKLFGQVCKLRAIAGLGLAGPLADLIEVIDFIEALQHRGAGGFFQSIKAYIIRAPFHASDSQLARSDLLKKGNIFLVKLLLQILGSGRDEHAASGGERGNQISKGLSGSGAGFDQSGAAVGKNVIDSFGHLDLAGPVFIVGMMLGY